MNSITTHDNALVIVLLVRKIPLYEISIALYL